MLRRILQTVVRWFGLEGLAQPASAPIAGPKFVLHTFEDRSAAASAARTAGVAALVLGGGREKWLLMTCPCGCGQEIALNLMQSQSPRWKVSVQSAKRFSVHPSVDATSCGAHFWLRDGRVIWCQ